ncbi:MAG: hypothetical protein KKD17_04655 [Nanoarchaeota archaeon]|nr:hypothetical protein [Nanoarchaeota archaeon]
MSLATFLATPTGALVILLLVIWESIWKGVALWKSGRNSQMGWFIALFVLNTVAILPIVYLWFFQKEPYIKRFKKAKKK